MVKKNRLVTMVGIGAVILWPLYVLAQGPLTNALNIRTRTDANGYLMAAAAAYLAPDGPLTNFANLRLRTDANGYLLTTLASGGSIVVPLSLTATALGTTSTDGLIVTNTTAATAGVTVQISPRVRLRGNAWDTAASETVDFFMENLPATAATPTGTWKLGYSLNGAAASYPLTVSSAGSGTFGGYILGGGTNIIGWSSRNYMSSTADGLWNTTNNGQTLGVQINAGTAAPTLGTCTGGSITSGSRNSAGEVTGNTSGSCIVNFGAPNWTNTPFCLVNDETNLVAARVSARSNSSFTITGLTSGDAVQWHCLGQI